MLKYLLLLLFLGSSATPLHASDTKTSVIRGVSYDRQTGQTLGFVYLYLEELNRTAVAHTDGHFEFVNVPEGRYTLSATRVGYRPATVQINVPQNDTLNIQIRLTPSVMSGEAIVVTGDKDITIGSELEHVSKSISGNNLRRDLSGTLAKTLEDLPGLDSRTMGAAPGRPIIRGLGGERILILQDGARTGDVSSQSADHAVTVDPIAAEKIEIARGPAALKYGGNAIGGVVNVVRNQIATSMPDHFHGTASIQGETVNSGGTTALQAGLPIGSFALQADGNFRTGQNLQTPEGKLENSDITSTNNALGLSYIRPWGYAGGAFSMYLNNYGIPPDPDGGHANGVNIEMQKFQLDGKSEIFFENSFFRAADISYSYKNYYHREVELGGVIGTEFGVLTSNASINTRHGEKGILQGGTLGIWAEAKNYAIQGANTPDSDSYSLAVYLIEEKDFGPLHTEVGGRFEAVNTLPVEEDPNSRIGNIRNRSFTGVSSSIAAIYDFGSGFFTGASLIHSFRAPSQEELYSEGPHLASYSYEIGNPDLQPERGFGKELFLRYRGMLFQAEFTGYHNDFSNYIYPRNTGRPSVRFPTLNEYQFFGADALLYGVEFSAEMAISSKIVISGSLNYTHGEREVTQQEQQAGGQISSIQPLPMIPPLKGMIDLTYSTGSLQIGSRLKAAAKQTRTGDFEEPTDGYLVLDLFGQYRFQRGNLLHTFSLRADNLLNETYFNHLSRIKELMPEPGRNVSLLYRVYF
ncbi:MAG: TonB-dependent receptor [Balneolaceae bacterium]|nr:TonB-dependent receptor [Balneolaceae bacterium]